MKCAEEYSIDVEVCVFYGFKIGVFCRICWVDMDVEDRTRLQFVPIYCPLSAKRDTTEKTAHCTLCKYDTFGS